MLYSVDDENKTHVLSCSTEELLVIYDALNERISNLMEYHKWDSAVLLEVRAIRDSIDNVCCNEIEKRLDSKSFEGIPRSWVRPARHK